MHRPGLSKTRIGQFEQCPKRLWLSVYHPELGQDSASVHASFASGHHVGAIACSLYPDGIMVEASGGMKAAAEQTSDLLKTGWDRPIFEGTFVRDDVLVRVDLMLPSDAGWHIAEVKSTTSAKAYQLADLATQLWVARECKVDIAAASIRHLDRNFTLATSGDYAGLFSDHFVGAEIEELIESRAGIVADAHAILAGPEPDQPMGTHCNEPFTCAFQVYCGRDLPPPPEWPAMLLPDITGKNVARSWAAKGIDDLTQIPANEMPNTKLRRVHDATLSGIPWHDRDAIVAETAEWAFPRTFLDFETIGLAVPRWIGTRPWQGVPFQFSAHIEADHGSISHHEFLSIDGSDPRRGCAEALSALPTGKGAIIAWNASFERGCLTGLATQFPDLAPVLYDMAGRLVDLLPVVRRHYYHRDMRGSWSIKAVLPTIAANLAYDGLADVRSGSDAQAGYAEAVAPETYPERRAAIHVALLEYCRRDTEAMMVVLDRLTR